MFMLKKRWQLAAGYIAVLINSSSQYSSTMISVPTGVICSAPKERNPKWRLSNNQFI
jgi:hypothetical protein